MHWAEGGLVALQAAAGLPWWAAIVCGGAALRTAVTLPLAAHQSRLLAKVGPGGGGGGHAGDVVCGENNKRGQRGVRGAVILPQKCGFGVVAAVTAFARGLLC